MARMMFDCQIICTLFIKRTIRKGIDKMSLILTTGVIAGGLKILAKFADQKINEWNSQARQAKTRASQMSAQPREQYPRRYPWERSSRT